MKIEIKNISNHDVCSIDDLIKLIPNGYSGSIKNYGQGEGQLKLDDIVWGIYAKTSSSYTLQYEEGVIELEVFLKLVSDLAVTIKEYFGEHIILNVEGILNIQEPIEKYL